MSITTRKRGDPLCIRMNDDICRRSVTLGEFLVDITWKYLINAIDFDKYQEELNRITIDTPGALEKDKGWDELEEYLYVLWCQDNNKKPPNIKLI